MAPLLVLLRWQLQLIQVPVVRKLLLLGVLRRLLGCRRQGSIWTAAAAAAVTKVDQRCR